MTRPRRSGHGAARIWQRTRDRRQAVPLQPGYFRCRHPPLSAGSRLCLDQSALTQSPYGVRRRSQFTSGLAGCEVNRTHQSNNTPIRTFFQGIDGFRHGLKHGRHDLEHGFDCGLAAFPQRRRPAAHRRSGDLHLPSPSASKKESLAPEILFVLFVGQPDICWLEAVWRPTNHPIVRIMERLAAVRIVRFRSLRRPAPFASRDGHSEVPLSVGLRLISYAENDLPANRPLDRFSRNGIPILSRT
jgi:hypothetical protein